MHDDKLDISVSQGIRPLTVKTQVAEELRRLIFVGELRPGQRLNESTLAASFGTSRGPVREAIQLLVSEGLVTIESYRGATVRKFGADELRELYELRRALELHAVELAAKNADAADIEDLGHLLSHTAQSMDMGGSEAPYPLHEDMDFHARLISLSGNRMIFEASMEVLNQLRLTRVRSGRESRRARKALQEHRDIVDAVASGNASKARSLLDGHLLASLATAESVAADTEANHNHNSAGTATS